MIAVFFVGFYQFPYYIEATGGAINVTERIKIKNSYESTGTLNMAYVRELPGTIPLMILANFNPNWDIVKENDILFDNETMEDNIKRNKILLEEATQDAIIVGYTKADKKVEILSSKLVVTYIDAKAKTNLLLNDEIIQIDGEFVKSIKDVKAIVTSKNVGDKIVVSGKRDKKDFEETATVYEEKGQKFIGVGASLIREVKTTPKVDLIFKKSESGPSGGLITSLAIYDALVETDITRGRKIVGTGTIDIDGNVGQIGGVKYKLAGAISEKADVFIVPAGSNYEEAIKIKKEQNLNIEIVGVKTFDDALEYLLK